jgi:hypothetical protein
MIGHSQATLSSHTLKPLSTSIDQYIANQPDTLQKNINSLLVNVDIPTDTKRPARIKLYPCKIDLEY